MPSPNHKVSFSRAGCHSHGFIPSRGRVIPTDLLCCNKIGANPTSMTPSYLCGIYGKRAQDQLLFVSNPQFVRVILRKDEDVAGYDCEVTGAISLLPLTLINCRSSCLDASVNPSNTIPVRFLEQLVQAMRTMQLIEPAPPGKSNLIGKMSSRFRRSNP